MKNSSFFFIPALTVFLFFSIDVSAQSNSNTVEEIEVVQQNKDGLFQLPKDPAYSSQEHHKNPNVGFPNSQDLRDERLYPRRIETIIAWSSACIFFLMFGFTFLYAIRRRGEFHLAEIYQDNLRERIAVFQDELMLSYKELDVQRASNKDKERILMAISHDLRDKLTGIDALSEILDHSWNTIPEHKKRSSFSALNAQVSSTVNLLEDLLDWAKAHQKGMVFSPKKVQLLAAFQETVEVFSEVAAQKDLSLKIVCSSCSMAYTDPNVLGFVLRNLVSNAIKFSYPGREVILCANMVDQKLTCSVKDQGKGMSEDVRYALLNTRSTTSSKGTDNEKGHGLGLLLTRDFIRLMGTELEIKSAKHRGTHVSFKIPRFVVPESETYPLLAP